MDGARRIFLGLPVAADTAHELHRWATRAVAETRLRVVPAANLHATLVFCGLLDDEQIDEVIAIVREETPVDLTWNLVPVDVRPLASVVAVVCDGNSSVVGVQNAIENRLVADGLAEREHRRWLPHVTFARGRRGERIRLPRVVPPPLVFGGDAIVVYESLLSPAGATYVALDASPRR